jgi:hypothetical protein
MELPESIPDERRLLLTLITPWRIALLHDRDWHVFHETQDMVMLRMVRDGSLLAQCNLSLAPQVAAGRFTEETRYLEEVNQALTERGGRVLSSKVIPDRNGWRMHQVTAAGEASGKVLIWDYVLCTAAGGEQVSLVFSHAEEDAAALDGVIDRMLDSLTLRTNRPKVALPR